MTSIRIAHPDDAARVLAIYEPIVRDTAVSFELVPPSLAEMRSRIASIAAVYPWLVAHLDDDFAGYAYASRHRERPAYQWSVDVSVYVAPHLRGHGVGRSLYAELLRLLADLGYVTAWAGIALPNAASVALHEAMGFTAVGVFPKVGYKLGGWHDVGWWRRSLRPHGSEPAPPISMVDYLQSTNGRDL